ncbi:MAG: MFS transporter, partial [Defluviicoccus sp.]|nr:MFS transporter [Defluviicoccus sp.]
MSSGNWRTPFVILLCGTTVMLIAFGIRMTYGLWISPASAGLGWGLESLSFAMAAQALIWGFATPVMGAIADRHGTGRVIAGCGIAFALGFIVTANATTRIEAFLGIGVLTGIAMGGLTAPIILTAISKVVEDEKKRGLYAGIASAGGSSGQVVLVPVIQAVLDATDWMTALLILAAVTALIVPLAWTMVSKPEQLAAASGQQSLGEALGEAFRHPGYLLLTAGYFVCGFQTLFIVTHFPPMLETYDVSPEMGA